MEKGIEVEKNMLQDEMYYDGHAILRYEIAYPQFDSQTFRSAANRMSVYYLDKAFAMERFCRKKLYAMAVAQYHFSQQEGYPVMQYEAVVDYNVTYNNNCTLSLYSDRYVYSGGANGSTTRSSDTWSLRTGRRVPLQRYAKDTQFLKDEMIAQISQQIQSGHNDYFDDYEKNVSEEFDPENFYLTPQGLTIYYQVYDIAPHSSGIVTFLIPYQKGKVSEPKC